MTIAPDMAVMSKDAGGKLIASSQEWHGPYRVAGLTKSGMVILEGRPCDRIPTRLLREADKPLHQ